MSNELQIWQKRDEDAFGSKPLNRTIVTLSNDLTFGTLISKGTLQLVKEQVEAVARKQTDKPLAVVVRTDTDLEGVTGKVIVSAYIDSPVEFRSYSKWR